MKWFGSNTGRSLPLPALQGKVIEVAERTFKVEEHLGDGGFAVIYRVRDLTSGEHFALKHVIMNSEEAKSALREEAKIMKKVQGHPNILCLHSVAFGHEKDGIQDAYMLMDLCKESLYLFMQKQNFKLEDAQIKSIFLNVCKAVQHLHSQKHPVLHRDIKVENVLRRPNGTWVLCDYGSAKSKSKSSSKNKNPHEEQQEINKTTTPAYRAPEMWDVMMGQRIDEKADIWALGCMLYLMCYGNLPFTGESQLEIMAGKNIFPQTRSVFFSKLVADMINVEPTQRPTIDGIIHLLERADQAPKLAKESVDLSLEQSNKRSSSLTSNTTSAPALPSKLVQAPTRDKNLATREMAAASSLKGERIMTIDLKQKTRNTESPVPIPKLIAPKTTVPMQRTLPEANTQMKETKESQKTVENEAAEDPEPLQHQDNLAEEVKSLQETVHKLVENNGKLWSKIVSLEKVVLSQEQSIQELRNNHQFSAATVTSEAAIPQKQPEEKDELPMNVSDDTMIVRQSPTEMLQSEDKPMESSIAAPSTPATTSVESTEAKIIPSPPDTSVPNSTHHVAKSSPNRFGGTFWMNRNQTHSGKHDNIHLVKEASEDNSSSVKHKRVVSDPPPLDSWHPSLGQ